MNTSENKSFCSMAWVHIAAHTDGSTRLCCMSSRFIKKDNGENFNLGYDKIEDIVNSTDYTQIRNDMLEGKSIKGCESCYESEKYSQTSHRTRFNTTWMKDERFVKKVEQSKNKEQRKVRITFYEKVPKHTIEETVWASKKDVPSNFSWAILGRHFPNHKDYPTSSYEVRFVA